MILHKLSLNNFGLFRGSQHIKLTPNGTGPVILIGGMNGTGKTTLLDAVRLCLYGKRSLGTRVSINEYHEYLLSMIHRNSDSGGVANCASVSLEFEYAHHSEKKQFCIIRSWEQRGKTLRSVKEDLSVFEDNRSHAEFDIEYWQNYLNELIPIGVSQFFFFDGEDIQKLVGNFKHNKFLAESIKDLLGLNLVERLQSDLRIYSNRLVKRGSPVPMQMEITGLESEIENLQKTLTHAETEQEETRTQINKLRADIVQQESRIAAEGGSYARKRGSLKLKQEQLHIEIEELENKIRELCSNLFPFALVPKLLDQLKKHLHKEIQLDEWEVKNRTLADQNREVLDKITSETFLNDMFLEPSQIDTIRDEIVPLFPTELELPKALRSFKKKRDRSPSEYNRLFEWIDVCLNEIPQYSRELNDNLITAQSELQKVEEDLQRAPSDEVLKPLLEILSELNLTLGRCLKQEQDTSKSIRSLTHQLTEAERKLKRLYHAQQLAKEHHQRQDQVTKVQTVLTTYSEQLTEVKVVTLSNSIVTAFNQLSHKPDRIKRAELDPQTFAFTLYGANNRCFSKEELSAGEKHIFTTALLWGLAKTSGKPLPMILDTPLGRLDTGHRKLLVERYFPYVSHQVVLLSTDTEIDRHFYSKLEPYISHTFHLAYQKTKEHTKIQEGYFK